ncbi:MAG: BrnT family toxin [Pyrinomonadaceae bacterium]|nr:BrnT family toxin [Pyrinomonadaceae bacterium]
MEFEWDLTKARSNQERHGVFFEEAVTVFLDEFAVQFLDDTYAGIEDRFILLGMSNNARVLVVVHCQRRENIIRLISARKATKSERRYYPGP